jgi:hypothetical protein
MTIRFLHCEVGQLGLPLRLTLLAIYCFRIPPLSLALPFWYYLHKQTSFPDELSDNFCGDGDLQWR